MAKAVNHFLLDPAVVYPINTWLYYYGGPGDQNTTTFQKHPIAILWTIAAFREMFFMSCVLTLRAPILYRLQTTKSTPLT